MKSKFLKRLQSYCTSVGKSCSKENLPSPGTHAWNIPMSRPCHTLREGLSKVSKALSEFHSSLAGRVVRQCWCTVKWAFPAPAPPWLLTPWSRSNGRWMWPWRMSRSAVPLSSPMRPSWSSCRPTTASSKPGETPEDRQQDSRGSCLQASEILMYADVIPASSATVHSGGDGLYERRKDGMSMKMRMKRVCLITKIQT